MELEASLRRWTPDQRELVFPNTVGHVTRYGAFLELVWQPLLRAAQLPYRKPRAMRHSYATWMLEAGADLRWVKDQLGHASIEETEGTYGHLEREHHEGRVNLDAVQGGVHSRPPASTLSDADGVRAGQLRDFPREDFLVEGKGFGRRHVISLGMLAHGLVQIDAKFPLSRHPAPQVVPLPWPGTRRRGIPPPAPGTRWGGWPRGAG